MNIIFQDIDGPLIPLRMYYSGNRPYNNNIGSFIYDPVAVGMINHLCQKFNAQIVFNSAHNENSEEIMRHQAKVNNIQYIHPTVKTNYNTLVLYGRYNAIEEWCRDNGPVDKWIVIDDINVYRPNQVLINYEIGMTIDSYYKACELFSEKIPRIIGVGQ